MANTSADFVSGGDDQGYQVTPDQMYAAYHRPGVGNQVGQWRPDDPTLPATQAQGWTNVTSGQRIQGQVSSDGRQIVTGFAGSNPQNTNSYDVQTGANIQADPHPWRDAA